MHFFKNVCPFCVVSYEYGVSTAKNRRRRKNSNNKYNVLRKHVHVVYFLTSMELALQKFQTINKNMYIFKNICPFCVFSYKYGVNTARNFKIFTMNYNVFIQYVRVVYFSYIFVHTPQVLPSRGRRRRRRRAEKNFSELAPPQPPCAGKKSE